jgi:hypothetical protein
MAATFALSASFMSGAAVHHFLDKERRTQVEWSQERRIEIPAKSLHLDRRIDRACLKEHISGVSVFGNRASTSGHTLTTGVENVFEALGHCLFSALFLAAEQAC